MVDEPVLGPAYITAEEFRKLEKNGIDLDDWDDPALGELLSASSRMIESYINDSFLLAKYSDERLVWNMQSHRVYPVHRPIRFAIELRLYFTQQSVAVFHAGALFNNTREDYIALTAFALQPQISIIPALIGTGLRQIVAGATYMSGYATPTDTGETLEQDVVQTTLVAIGPGEPAVETWTVSDASTFAVDDLLRLGTEDCLVEATDETLDTITVLRNGTNTAHLSGTPISRYVASVPNDAKAATWLTAAHLIGAQGQREEGLEGLVQAVIGSYSVSLSTPTRWFGGDTSSGGMPYVPDAAKAILQKYRKIRLQGA